MTDITKIVRSILVGLTCWAVAAPSDAKLVVIVSAQSPVKVLGEHQVADIYLGRAGRLNGIGDVQPVDLGENSALHDEFYRIVAGKSDAQLRVYWSALIFTGRGQPPRELDSAAAVRRFVASHPNAIGYIDASDVDASVKVVLALKSGGAR